MLARSTHRTSQRCVRESCERLGALDQARAEAIEGARTRAGRGLQGFLRAVRESGMELLTITLDHVATALLPPVHRDPFDRMIAGQAIADRLTVMTSDPVFTRYEGLRVLGA